MSLAARITTADDFSALRESMRPHRQIAICRYLTDACGAAAAAAVLAVAFSVSLGTTAISGGL